MVSIARGVGGGEVDHVVLREHRKSRAGREIGRVYGGVPVGHWRPDGTKPINPSRTMSR
jgi:hypothetical protein